MVSVILIVGRKGQVEHHHKFVRVVPIPATDGTRQVGDIVVTGETPAALSRIDVDKVSFLYPIFL